jgi:OMF family outer membrane factor
VKGQYLFYSFLPGVTAAVLTTQTALATTVSGTPIVSSAGVLTFPDSPTWLGDNINTKMRDTNADVFPDVVPESELTRLQLQSSSSKNNPASLSKKTGTPLQNQPSQKDEGKVGVTHGQNFAQTSEQHHDFHNHQQPTQVGTSGNKLNQTVVANVIPPRTSTQPVSFTLSALQQPTATGKQQQTHLSTILPTAVTGGRATKLLGVHGCSAISGCLPPSRTRNLIAASYPSASNTNSGLVNTGGILTFPSPGTEYVAPVTTGENITPVEKVEFTPTNRVEIPDYLTPSPNLLQFPTKPEEVRLETNQPITLAQALELARRNNRDLQVSLLELERDQAALRQEQAALLPNLGLTTDVSRGRSADAQRSIRLQEQQTGIPQPGAETISSFRGEAQLSYDLFTSGRRQATIKQAEERLKFSELAVERQSEEIRLNVATEYYNLQQADERVRIAQSAVENSQASLRDAQALERAGVGTRFDVLQSQVNLANSQQELTNARSQQEIARRILATRLSVPQSINLSAADPVQLAGLWNRDLETSIVLAFQNRPELQQQLAQRNISEQQQREALASLGPQVRFIASYNLLDQFDDGVSLTDGYSVGVRASLNLYDGGAAKASAAQAKTNVAIAETQFSEQRNQIRFQVEQAFSTQRASLENVQTANAALEQAREALRLARLRFQAGVGTQTDVINSENDLTRAEGNRITAILDYNRALAQLQRAVTSRALAE